MVGRRSKNAEQSPSSGTAILVMLSSNVFHEKLSIQSIAPLRFGARRTWTPLPSFFLSFPREGRAAPRSINRSRAGRSPRLRRCRTLQPRARSTESWLNLTFPAGLMSCNRRCGEHAKSCGKDVGLLWDLKGIGVNTRSPRFPRTGVMGFRCFSENSFGSNPNLACPRHNDGSIGYAGESDGGLLASKDIIVANHARKKGN